MDRKYKLGIPAAVYILLIFLFIYLPVVIIIVFSFNSGKSMFKWSGFSFVWYKELLADQDVSEAVRNTFVIGVISSFCATVIGTLGCVGLLSFKKRRGLYSM